MEKVVKIALRVILAILFLQNINFFSFVSNLKTPAERQAPQKADGGENDRMFLNEKITKAKQLGDNYGPEAYFSDLTEIKVKESKNDFDERAIINVGYTTNLLCGRFNQNVLNHRKSDSQMGYDEYLKRLGVARTKHLNITDPDAEKRAQEFKIKTSNPSFWTKALIDLFSWLVNFYCKNLPLALILLWLWWYEDKNKLSISNPLSFLICLVLYPFVITRVWLLSIRNVSRIFAMSIDYKRRQRTLFSLISDDEMASIKRFAKSDLKLSDYQNYLESRRLVYRHALLPVVMVTCILLLVPRFAGATTSHQSEKITECQLCIKAPPNSNHFDDFALSAIMPPVQEVMFVMSLVWQFILPPIPKKCGGFKTNPDPIPLVA